MLGFTVPLFIVLGVETLVGLLLLSPRTLNKPAIELARASYTPIGRTVTHTLAGVLCLLLASPLYDAYRLYRISEKTEKEHYDSDLGMTEATTTLSLVMILGALGGLFVLRKLGRVMGEKERMEASEAALLKQVKGLQAEYMRVADNKAPAGSAEAKAEADVEALRSAARAAEERAKAAEKAQKAAEANLDALKAQAGGLGKEYDRLAAEHSRLERQLAQATGAAVGGGMTKKDD